MTNTPSPTDEDRELMKGNAEWLRRIVEPGTEIAGVISGGGRDRILRIADRLESLLSDRAKLEERVRELGALVFEMDEQVNDCCGCLGHIDEEFRERINAAALNRSTDRAT